MPVFEFEIICLDGHVEFVKQHMDKFDEIKNSTEHPFGIVGLKSLRNLREVVKMINKLKENTGDTKNAITFRALEK